MRSYDDGDFQELIEQSSLGTPGAFGLRQQTNGTQVDAVRRIVQLRNRMESADQRDQVRAAAALVEHLRAQGHDRQADTIVVNFPQHSVLSADSAAHLAAADQNQHSGPGIDTTAAAFAGGPTMARMLLGRRLRQLRERRGINRDEAGYRIRCSASRIVRIEGGWTATRLRDVLDLLAFYGIDDADEEKALCELVVHANTPGWWHRYDDVVPAWFQNYLGLEAAAVSIRSYQMQFIPALLQTPSYAEALIRHVHPTAAPADLQRRVQARIDQQQVLHRVVPRAPEVRVVIDEAALCRAVGGSTVMRDQIDALIDLTDLPNLSLQILPLNTGGSLGAGSSFTVLGFDHQTLPDAVYIEQLTSALVLDLPADVASYQRAFDELTEQAESPESSAEILKRLLYESHDD